MPISFCPVGGESYNLMPGTGCPVHDVPLESFMPQGVLQIFGNQSLLNGMILARAGHVDPFGAATSFVANANCVSGDTVEVRGDSGLVGGVAVLFIDSVRRI